jgi:hypothetical protein
MNKKVIIIGGLALLGIGAGIYFYIRSKNKNTNKDTTEKDKAEKDGKIEKETDKSEVTPPVNPVTPEKEISSKVQTTIRPYTHINKRLDDLKGILKDIEIKNGDLKYKDGRVLGKDIKNTLFMTISRNISSLKDGLQKDNDVNKETKDYLFSQITDFMNLAEKYFPTDKYNSKQDWYVKAMKGIIPTNFYLK